MNSDAKSITSITRAERALSGLPVAKGCAVGRVCLLRTGKLETVPERRIERKQVAHELARLEAAFTTTYRQVETLAQNLKKHNGDEELSIFDGHLMMLEDTLLVEACNEKISEELYDAVSAVRLVANSYLTIFEAMNDSRLRERAQDIKDIAKRLTQNLLGESENLATYLTQPSVVIAEELTPSDTISLPFELILGVVTERGSVTSHAALLARALGIPAVAGVEGLLKSVAEGDVAMLDGTTGSVVINPDVATCERCERVMAQQRAQREEPLDMVPGATLDGLAVPLLANVDSSTPLGRLAANGAEGVGLYRTEYLWLRDNREPSEDEQAQAYSEVVRAVADGYVTIRVLDIGGDKALAGEGSTSHEANPFLGNRSIRFLLQRREIFRRQLRAILRASAHGKVRVMYPMIATIEELRAANSELEQCMAQLNAQGVPFDAQIKRGVMIEIPAAALIAEALARECDFFSIGTNDLIQYSLAVDRGNASVAQLFQPAHYAVLRLIELSVAAAHAEGLRVSVCGEMAADPIMAVLLVGLGVDELSMSPNLIGAIRETLRLVTFAQAQAVAADALSRIDQSGADIYSACAERIKRLVAEASSGS